ncbi:MAG: 4Fe-4S dicluster domain-containing protein [Eubacteriaceae bacterium]|nr:4Fe-4S dicluster domain-containing protein [Eubacteriaceae bacterium]
MKRIFIEADLCDGCKNCSVACMQSHAEGIQANVYFLDLEDTANESRNKILLDGDGAYKPIFCRHCDEPECVMSCMSGALSKDKQSGLVLYDRDKCGQCFMCVMNCPYGVTKPDRATRSYVVKCDFCADSGFDPNCVKSCPKKAIYVGEA